MSPGVPRMTSTSVAAGYRSHGREEWRMAPKITANVQQPTQLTAKIVSVSRKPPAKNPRFSGMTCHFQNDSTAAPSARRSDLEPEQPLDEIDRADGEQRQEQEEQRARRVGLEAGERLLLDLLRVEHQVGDGDRHGD